MDYPITLLLVDDHEIFLDGVVSLLSSSARLDILGKSTSAPSALDLIEECQPMVLITDLSMPEMSGVELVRIVKEKYPEIKVLVLSMHDDRETVSEIIMAEAEGYILKNTGKKELLEAIDRIHQGGTYYSNRVMEIMLERYQAKEKRQEAESSLTMRELEILELIAQEKSSKEIAEALFISVRTVDTHRKHLLKKANTSTVIGLLKYGIHHGLISLS